MPINNIPGVGPTNADIATAVAAPSAATIAATVAAPSAATIATSVAGAVPTIGAINTSVSTYAPSPNAWTLLGTVTPNNTANSVTFSGLSGYRTYKIVCAWIVVTGQCDGAWLRINGDATSNNYTTQGISISTNNSAWGAGSSPSDKYCLASGFGSSSGQISGIAYIYNASSTGPKDFSSNFSFTSDSSGSGRPMNNGSWPGTAVVNSITLLHTYAGTFGGGKSIYLFGAN